MSHLRLVHAKHRVSIDFPIGVRVTYCEKYSRTVMQKTPHGMVKKTVQEAYA